MEKVRLNIYRLVPGEQGHFILVMEEVEGNRRLPIVIGMPEAQAIALALEEIKPPRPLTHDLMHNISKAYEIELMEVQITDLKEGTFYGRLVLKKDGEYQYIDCRPSDGIALAVRFHAPVFIAESIMQEVGLDAEEEAEPHSESLPKSPVRPSLRIESQTQNRAEQLESLNKKLDEALLNEDYELAAQIRDKIKQLGQSSS